MWSTSVVLPWSTWATMATLRILSLEIMVRRSMLGVCTGPPETPGGAGLICAPTHRGNDGRWSGIQPCGAGARRRGLLLPGSLQLVGRQEAADPLAHQRRLLQRRGVGAAR